MDISIKTLKKLTMKKYRREFSLCICEGEKIIKDNADIIVKIFNNDEVPKDIKELENYSGRIAVAKIPAPRQPTVPCLVLDKIQDAGNMGAILRTAFAFGYETIFCCECADSYSQKVIRSSSGYSLKLNIYECDYGGLPKDILYYIADLDGDNAASIKTKDKNFGLVLGSEGQGVSNEIFALPHKVITIPMQKDCESLNVAVAGGILMHSLDKNG
jgi:TrmH family RNA methyltransferase